VAVRTNSRFVQTSVGYPAARRTTAATTGHDVSLIPDRSTRQRRTGGGVEDVAVHVSPFAPRNC
jgi:hypothetical protein